MPMESAQEIMSAVRPLMSPHDNKFHVVRGPPLSYALFVVESSFSWCVYLVRQGAALLSIALPGECSDPTALLDELMGMWCLVGL